jgi:hypothetical protein
MWIKKSLWRLRGYKAIGYSLQEKKVSLVSERENQKIEYDYYLELGI